VTLSVVIL